MKILHSPTEQIRSLEILDEFGKLVEGERKAHAEGQRLRLTCRARGGYRITGRNVFVMLYMK